MVKKADGVASQRQGHGDDVKTTRRGLGNARVAWIGDVASIQALAPNVLEAQTVVMPGMASDAEEGGNGGDDKWGPHISGCRGNNNGGLSRCGGTGVGCCWAMQSACAGTCVSGELGRDARPAQVAWVA